MGDLIYVVSDGEIEILRRLTGGGEELLTLETPGDYFGEMGALFNLPRSATARARTDATVIGYTVQQFRANLAPTGVRGLITGEPSASHS